jgi:hypothetical protein
MASLSDLVRPGIVGGLDFVSLDELRKRTGITVDKVLPFALNEMLTNALDKFDAVEIRIDLQEDGEFNRLIVADNGTKKLSRTEIELIVDFENKASSKRGFLRVSRGYLGNALKCIFGYSYVLAESRNLAPPEITVASGDRQFKLCLKPDRVQGVINTDIVESKRLDNGYTAFTLKFPRIEADHTAATLKRIATIIVATSIVNWNRRISFNIHGSQATLGNAEGAKAIRQETSVAWYTSKRFSELYEDFLRASPETQIKEFIGLFRGFSGRKAIGEILQELNASNDDSEAKASVQFFPTSTLEQLSTNNVKALLQAMKSRTKPIGKRSIPAVLGLVGEANFERFGKEQGYKRLRYVVLSGTTVEYPDSKGLCKFRTPARLQCKSLDHVEYPYLVELTVFDRDEDDKDGLQVFNCVNFMASTEPIFSESFNVHFRLGQVGIKAETPATIIVHLVCPVLNWLNYGKNALDYVDDENLMEKAFDKILPIPKQRREYHPPPPPRPLSWVPHGKLEDPVYEARLKPFAAEIKAIDALRTHPIKPSSRGWAYQLEGFGKIDKGDFDACQKAINDCRKIGLLPIDFVAEDQDITRHFKGIHNASDPTVSLRQIRHDVEEMLQCLPSNITDYWTGEAYYVMICVEKGDLLNLFKPILNEYHVPIVSSKGWAPILLRSHIANLSRKAEANNLKPVLLLFYDHDPAGLKITNTFRKNLEDCQKGTGWNPCKLIIDRFGLNKVDIDRFNLTWIENLKTGSGRESRDYEYVKEFGKRKCEANALFKNDETLRAGEEICRHAIEKYYGPDARDRFRKKEENSKQKLAHVYDNPAWQDFYNAVDGILESFSTEAKPENENVSASVPEKEVDVFVDDKFYGSCPSCGDHFNYSKEDVGRLVRCRNCNAPMRLKKKTDVSGSMQLQPEECERKE